MKEKISGVFGSVPLQLIQSAKCGTMASELETPDIDAAFVSFYEKVLIHTSISCLHHQKH